jgi:hypothetical protein
MAAIRGFSAPARFSSHVYIFKAPRMPRAGIRGTKVEGIPSQSKEDKTNNNRAYVEANISIAQYEK